MNTIPAYHIESAMQSSDKIYDLHARAREKQASREQDERDLRSGRKSVEQLCRENELLGSLARTARVDFRRTAPTTAALTNSSVPVPTIPVRAPYGIAPPT